MLVVFWELTSLFSFLLIGYWNQTTAARDGARMALIVTAAGGLCLLAGVLVLGHIVGSYDLDRGAGGGRRASASTRSTCRRSLLILLGAFTKSAQFPFHFWLPNAMAAPTPVSAYLHSATMVKAGVFLLVRFSPVLGGTDAWFWIVGTAGMTTLLLGAFFALFQHDLKGLLAYSTISHLGLITVARRHRHAARHGGGDLPHHEPRGVQGLAVHGRRHHRPRDRHPRHAPAERPAPLMPITATPRHRRLGGHGRGAAAERLPLQGDVLRRGRRCRQGHARSTR